MTARWLLLAVSLVAPGIAARAQVNVAEVQVAPPTVSIRVGERTGLLATAFDRIGNVIPTVRFTWSSNNVSVATVDNTGTVSGVGGGVAIIEARAGSRRGQAVVQVAGAPARQPRAQEPPQQEPAGGPPSGEPAADPLAGQPPGTGPAAALRIDPPVVYLLPSEHIRIFPRALREDGSPAAPVRVTWRSLREDIARVDQNGNVIAIGPGQGTIQVTAPGGVTQTAAVVVQQADIAIAEQDPLTLSPGQIDTLGVVVPTQNNRPLNPLSLQWSSSNAAVARVTVLGIVAGAGPGRATLTVSGFLQTRTIEVTVHRPVERLVVRPPFAADVVLPLTGTQRFEAEGLASDNTPVPEAPMQWTVADTAIATFNPVTGVLTGKGAGKTQLVVRGPGAGLSVTWTINVVAGAPKLAASRLGLAPGERLALKANYVDDGGASIGPATNLSWGSDRPDVATVGTDGTVTAVGYGRARITGTAPGGRADGADVFVQGEILVASNRGGRFQLYATERANLAQLRRVSDDTGSASEPAYSPDGSRIAFVSTRDGNPELYVMDADGGNLARLTNHAQADGHPVFTPDGQAIVFDAPRTKNEQIYIMGLDGGAARALTQEPGTNMMPTVSPDGGTIAYVSVQRDNYDVWLMSRDGTNQRPFTRSPQQRESYPRFLRDGTLAYLVERREGNRTVTQVVKADLATGQVTPLTGTDLFIASYAVSPAGDLLALVVPLPGQERRRNPASKVYIQPVGGGAPVPIPASAQEQLTTPAFQP